LSSPRSALPQIMMLVLPIAAFVATLYIFNRMIGESELVVMQTAGLSAWRLMRPVLVFGLFLAALIGILANVLAPAARSQFIDRSAEVQEDLTGTLPARGRVHPPHRGADRLYPRDHRTGRVPRPLPAGQVAAESGDDLYRDHRASGPVRGRAQAGDVRRHGAVARPGDRGGCRR
jgi:hypothetical protein